MTRHIVRSFDDILTTVTADLLRMGQCAREALVGAIKGLDNATSQETVPPVQALEDIVDELNEKIEIEVQHTLALRQPMASDLRALISANRIATDLERIGDHAKNIAKRAEIIRGQGVPMDFSRLLSLADLTLQQLDAILIAIEQGDATAAKTIWTDDAKVDALFDEAFTDQLAEICATTNNAVSCAHMLFIAKAFERIGDHVTNIAEDLVYWVTGDRMNKRRTQ
jgi:phosphate transport system protein